MRPCSQRSYDFPTKTLAVRAFLYPKAQFGRWPVAVFQPRHAKAFIAIAPSDDEGKDIRVRGPHSFFASRNVFAPGGRVPSHEPGDRGRDAGKNLLYVRYLKLAELQYWGLNKNHFGDQKRAALRASIRHIKISEADEIVEGRIGQKALDCADYRVYSYEDATLAKHPHFTLYPPDNYFPIGKLCNRLIVTVFDNHP